MDDVSVNQYEKQLYSVFKSFDVNNEESLDETAVIQLCGDLQLEERGAALVDTLFEGRQGRVTFTQFRNGLLTVLGEPRTAAAPSGLGPQPRCDDDSATREVAPKFVFGTKKYGRRSRPHLATEERPHPRAASASRAEGEDRRSPPRRSSSAAERSGALEHDRRVGADEALALCRALRMPAIERRLVERVFADAAVAETTVGDFFDRLDRALPRAAVPPPPTDDAGDSDDELPAESVAELWESAGVRRPRRLLADLGFGDARVRPPELERALDHELRAVDACDERPDGRAALPLAALALARARAAAARRRRAAAAAERDKLRTDVADANRRAALLAQEVDESHARMQADLAASLQRAEARHADELRRLAADAAADRERAAAEHARLLAELARRGEAEARAADRAAELRHRLDDAEARALAADERRAAAEREAARAEARAAEAEARGAGAPEAEAVAELRARLEELQRDNRRLRDRADELAAALEGPAAPQAPPPPVTDLSAELHSSMFSDTGEGRAASLGAPPDDDDDERRRLAEVVRELEGALEAMRGEYDACEEYWAGKLREERAAHEADARAGDERLAELAARVADFERRLALPPIPEAGALEAQVLALEDEHRRYRRDAEARLRAATAAAGARAAAGAGAGAAEGGRRATCRRCRRAPELAARLAARCARAEAAARRLAARLAAADVLVKELYVENCQLVARAPL